MTSLVLSPQRAGLPLVPYLTVAEWKAAPTGIEVDDLVPGGTEAQQDAAIYARILQATSWVDGVVNYVMGATSDTEVGRFRVRRDGTVAIPLRGLPVLEVTAFSVGPSPSTMSTLTASQSTDGWIEDNVLIMPVNGSGGQASQPQFPLYPGVGGVGNTVYCQYTYVNGYANALLANGTASSGASSLTLQGSALGIYAGTPLIIYDVAGGSEAVTVASTYTTGSLTVPLAAALVNTHTASTNQPVVVSNLPPRVKEACILATSSFIKTRGGGALIDGGPDAMPRRMMGNEGGGGEDLDLARTLLTPFVNPLF